MKKKLGKLVTQILADGREISIGPHDGLAGYYARVYVVQDLDECEECKQPLLGDWDDYGHGHTALEALENAMNFIEMGHPHHAYNPHDFEES